MAISPPKSRIMKTDSGRVCQPMGLNKISTNPKCPKGDTDGKNPLNHHILKMPTLNLFKKTLKHQSLKCCFPICFPFQVFHATRLQVFLGCELFQVFSGTLHVVPHIYPIVPVARINNQGPGWSFACFYSTWIKPKIFKDSPPKILEGCP